MTKTRTVPAPKYPRWQYIIREIDFGRDGLDLNELGDQGWELVSVVLDPNGVHKFYFKRPVPRADNDLWKP
jgi:hypothetical protein